MVQTLTDIKALLASRGIHPRKRFGQNFLIDANKLREIVEAAAPANLALEVGPGTGVLTEALLEAGSRVVAVEIDRDMCAILRERLAGNERFTLIEADVMAGKHAINPAVIDALPGEEHSNVLKNIRIRKSISDIPHPTSDIPFTLVANLPYNIASPLLAVLAADHPRMHSAVVMVQKEVGERMMAAHGTKDFGPLSVILQAMGELERITTLPPSCFWPQPKVDSVVVRFTRRARPLTDNPRKLMQVVQKLFQKRRKQIGSILGRNTPLPTGIDPAARPEQLSVEQLVSITEGAETLSHGEEFRKAENQKSRKA